MTSVSLHLHRNSQHTADSVKFCKNFKSAVERQQKLAGEGGASWLCMTIGSVVTARWAVGTGAGNYVKACDTHTHTRTGTGRGWEGRGWGRWE